MYDTSFSDFGANSSPRRKDEPNYSSYNLSISLKCDWEVKDHQRLVLFGNIPELGNWTEPKIYMRRTRENMWVMENQLVTQQYYFCCKFAIINKYNLQEKTWERGVDRIIDMEILPTIPSGSYDQGVKACELNLEWEVFYVRFSCSYPIDDPNDQLILNGSKPEIQHILLKRSEVSKNWMHVKYGDVTKPWECTIRFPNIE